jgi:hypothetical protein
MKFRLLTIGLILCTEVKSQNFFTTAFAGASNYAGDIQDKAFTLIRAKPAWGIGLMFELNPRMLIRADMSFAKLYANDKFSKINQARNLSFNSDITEFSVGFEYVLFDLYEHKVSPYVFTGVGIFKFSPYVEASNGSRIILSELDTEGQGFYQGRKKYNLRQLCIPFGGGLQWALTDNKRIAFVIGVRKTFTDYLDDVSTTYIDENLLRQQRGAQAVKMAYRGDELSNGASYPQDGAIRGNPKSKDLYYFTGVSMRFRIGGKKKVKEPSVKIRRGSIPCPKPF